MGKPLSDFKHLSDYDAELGEIARLAKQYASSDPNGSLTKTRTLAETIAIKIGDSEKLPQRENEDLNNFLLRLKEEGHLPKAQAVLFHEIRKRGNDGAHGNGSKAQALLSLSDSDKLTRWYCKKYPLTKNNPPSDQPRLIGPPGSSKKTSDKIGFSRIQKTAAEELAQSIRAGTYIEPPDPPRVVPEGTVLPWKSRGLLIALIVSLLSMPLVYGEYQERRAAQELAEHQRAEQQEIERQKAERFQAELLRAEQQEAERRRAEQRAENLQIKEWEAKRLAEQQEIERQRIEEQEAERLRAEQQEIERRRIEQQEAERPRIELEAEDIEKWSEYIRELERKYVEEKSTGHPWIAQQKEWGEKNEEAQQRWAKDSGAPLSTIPKVLPCQQPCQRPHRAETMSQDEVDAIRRQILKCWIVPEAARYTENPIVRVRIFLQPNGLLAQMPEIHVEDGARTRMSGEEAYHAVVDSAIRAVHNCEPLENLPVDKYNSWRVIDFEFDPRERWVWLQLTYD